jgi:hypothetical protein
MGQTDQMVDLVVLTLLPRNSILGKHGAPQRFRDVAMVFAVAGFLQLLAATPSSDSPGVNLGSGRAESFAKRPASSDSSRKLE